jgi:hypothetical protein
MNWVLFVGGTWAAVACAVALVIGRSIHLANQDAAETGRDDAVESAVAPPPAAAPGIRQHSPSLAPIRRHTPSPSPSARSPFIGGCVSPSERAPSEHEHGVI